MMKFDYDLFFRSYARVHAGNWSLNYTEYCAQCDEHPLPYLRVNVVLAQFDEFYKTYEIEADDGMYIALEDRVKIW